MHMLCTNLFQMALEDSEAAKALVKEKNHITRTLKKHISPELFLRLAAKQPASDLIELLIKNAELDKDLADKIKWCNAVRFDPAAMTPIPETLKKLVTILKKLPSRNEELDGRTKAAVEHNPLVKQKRKRSSS